MQFQLSAMPCSSMYAVMRSPQDSNTAAGIVSVCPNNNEMTFDLNIWHAGCPHLDQVRRSRSYVNILGRKGEKWSFSATDTRDESMWPTSRPEFETVNKNRRLVGCCRVRCVKMVGATSSGGFPVYCSYSE